MSNKEIHELFNIRKVEKELPDVIPESIDIEQQLIEEAGKSFDLDFLTARNNTLFVLDRTKMALEEISLIAKDRESAKEYEALNGLLKTLNETTRNLMEMHERRKKFKEQTFRKDKKSEDVSVVNNNAFFIGSSSNLEKFIEQRMKDVTPNG